MAGKNSIGEDRGAGHPSDEATRMSPQAHPSLLLLETARRPTAGMVSSAQANFNGNTPFGKGEKGPYLGRPTRVGAYPSNKLGLVDMHGNMWQWTPSAA